MMKDVGMIKTVTDLSHALFDTESKRVKVSAFTAAIGLIYLIYEYAEQHQDGFACDEQFAQFVGYESRPDALKRSLLRSGLVEEKDGALYLC